MSTRDEYIHKLQTKLEEWNSEIDKLSARAGKVSADARKELHEQIDSLKIKHSTTHQKIEEIQHAGEGAWKDMKSGVELALTAMGEAIDSARSRFK
jgi:predicted  nucleic acid-binding Zn-ribbon protein